MGFIRRLFGHDPVARSALPPAAGSGADATLRATQLIEQGNTLEDAGRPAEAVACYRDAVRLASELPRAHLNLGIGLAACGDLAAAIVAYRDGLRLDAAHPFLHYNLANALHARGDHAAALRHVQHALDSKADMADALALLASVQEELGDHELALGTLERALVLHPDHVGLHVNHVRQLQSLLRVDESIACARGALDAFPDNADLHWNLAVGYLLKGDFSAGWREHEWRPQTPADRSMPEQQVPLWNGRQDLRGRTLLVQSEYGFGDAIQFVRFVLPLAQRCARVVVRVHQPLVALFQSCLPANCTVVDHADQVPAADFQCWLLSLAHLLGVSDPAAFARDVPYLHADASRMDAWRTRLRAAGRLNVGLVWCGNPAHGNDRNRSVPLAQLKAALAPLAEDGVRFVSLMPQLRDTDRNAAAAWRELLPLGLELRDFADTAALVAALDLVVSVDTSAAHLAGALDRPVWVLVPHVPDWRWMLDRADSPWYPAARLYRQCAQRTWQGALSTLRDDLRELSGRV